MCARKGRRGGILLLALLLTGCRTAVPFATLTPVSAPLTVPAAPTLYTAMGAVRALAAGPDGTLWAATAGGALCWRPGLAAPIRWTAADGLAGSDVRALEPSGQGAVAVTPTRLCDLIGAAAVPEAGLTGQEMRCLLRDQFGHGWLGTNKGVYARSGSRWQLRFPGEAWRMASDGAWPYAITARGLLRLNDGQLFPLPSAVDDMGTVTALAVSPGGVFLATALGLWRWDGKQWQTLALPPGSPASHVSALCVKNGLVYAGLYGDGVYEWQAGQWRRVPDAARQSQYVTALAATPGGVAVGTRTGGVWDWTNSRWQARAQPAALPSGDIYGLAVYRGALWAGTFDSGLLRMDSQGQKVITRADGLRADAPRALVVFGDRLYVRHTTGQVDCTGDGLSWHPAFTTRELPRSLVSALATDGRRLYIGGWAGWSAWNGQTWEHHDHDPALAHQVVTAIAARPGEVWIGTQKQGLFRYANGGYTHFFEAQGLTDDWITCLSVTPYRVLVGTYTGGLLQLNAPSENPCFSVILKPRNFAVRAVSLRPDGQALAATPLGVYAEGAHGWRLLDPRRCGGQETQALLALPTGAWIGSRTGLAFLPMPEQFYAASQ